MAVIYSGSSNKYDLFTWESIKKLGEYDFLTKGDKLLYDSEDRKTGMIVNAMYAIAIVVAIYLFLSVIKK